MPYSFEGECGPVTATVDVIGEADPLGGFYMEMNATYSGYDFMFNFEELLARLGELDSIPEPTLEELSSEEWLTYVREVEREGMAIGRKSCSVAPGEWRE